MIASIFNSIIFPIELLIASYICAVKIHKRPCWGGRMGLSVAAACAYMLAVDTVLPGTMLVKGILTFLSTVLFCGVLLFWIYDITLKDAMYCCMIGYAMQHFASCLYIFMSILLYGKTPAGMWVNRSNFFLYIVVYIFSYGLLYLLFARNLPKDW